MSVCKHYVNNKCRNENCKFLHIDNICRNYFFNNCNNLNCKYIHDYKLNPNANKIHKPKNTTNFTPDLSQPDMRVIINKPIYNSNEVCIINNIFWNINTFDILKKELYYNKDIYKLWHGDNHSIADDSLNWKNDSPIFNDIINILCQRFSMTPSATRLNLYKDNNDWKPYHHDAAAIKPEKAKIQNITVGVSFGCTREISFQHAKSYDRINFQLENGTVYAFGNKINIDYKHGIPQTIKNRDNYERFSIIIWGYSNNLN